MARVPPTDARTFHGWLMSSEQSFDHLKYSVLALGDSNYPHFCKAGRMLDNKLLTLGAQRLTPCTDIDQEDWTLIQSWFQQALDAIASTEVSAALDYLKISHDVESDFGPNRNRPFMSQLKVKYQLTTRETDDDKETIHCEFDVADSGISWISGDALGIYPQNQPRAIKDLMLALQCSGKEMVATPSWAYEPKPGPSLSLEEALQKYYDLKHIRHDFLTFLKRYATDGDECAKISHLLKEGTSSRNTELHGYLGERELCDILQDFPTTRTCISLTDLLDQLRPLQPRYYSISSSPQLDDTTVCVTAAVLRYVSLKKDRWGVTTCYLQDLVKPRDACPVFISVNPDFRLAADQDKPVILIGPGTGIAPFRAFIQERTKAKCQSETRLYFGCRHEKKDFLYKDELESLAKEGILELRLAFSRDGASKVYVQDLLRQDSAHIWQMISLGANIYVCGDAKHMAKDVHNTLVEIVTIHGQLADAEKFWHGMENEGRYQKDVWIT